MTPAPIIPVLRKDPFDDPGFVFELKYDGFRGLADTLRGRMLSKNGNPMKRFKGLLDILPRGFVFDGEIVALDERGRPVFNDLLFGRREATYIPFDILVVEGEDVRELPLKERKALLEKTEPFFGEGRPLFRAVCRLDLEGIVAKKLDEPYKPGRTKWWKILDPDYSQKVDRAELFDRRYG